MAPKAEKEKPAAKAVKKADDKDGKVTKPKRGKARNYDLGNGIYRFSRTRMFHKKALWKFIGKKTPKQPREKKKLFVEKPIGGEKNGKTRIVSLRKHRNYYPTADKIKKRPSKRFFKDHKRTLRQTLTPGTVCILLAGNHKGKRCVFIKQLESGLLLVNGPFLVNACPMRRVHPRYVIATQTKLDISGCKINENLNDEYFAREKKKRTKKTDGDIFAKKKEGYKPSEQRKTDQKELDKEIIKVIRTHPDKKLMFAYLATMWGLRSSQYPHRMKF